MSINRAVVVTTLPILLAVGVAAVVVSSPAPQQKVTRVTHQDNVVVQLPEQWVPFSAKIVYTQQGRVRYGKFFRSSNGSNTTVNESNDGVPVITIHNFASRQTFAHLGQQGWIAYPLDERQSNSPKPRISASAKKLRQLSTSIADAPVYEFTRSGGVSRLAAGLNGFPVYLEELDGRTIEFTDIVLGEPPASVFAPLPGARPVVKKRNDVLARTPLRGKRTP